MYSIIREHWLDSSHSFCHVLALLWESRHFCHNSGAALESQLNDLKPVSPIHWALATQVHCERTRPPLRDASPLALCYTLIEYTLIMLWFAYNLNSFDPIFTCGFLRMRSTSLGNWFSQMWNRYSQSKLSRWNIFRFFVFEVLETKF